MKIKEIRAVEILDSRGNPTVETTVTLEDGSFGRASVPSGASVGTYETLELRDNDEKRYGGKGVLKAVNNVNQIFNTVLKGQESENQAVIDHLMSETDGTPNKTRLGGNAILSISIANAKASANYQKIPLWKWLHMISGTENAPEFPTPMFNIMNGGAHASNNIAIQEFMVVPNGIEEIDKRIEAGVLINRALKKILQANGLDVSVGDEGGYAPSPEKALNDDEDVIEFILQAIKDAGYKAGEEVYLSLDMAISRYYDKNTNTYDIPNQREGDVKGDYKTVCSYVENLCTKYPFLSIEDALHEDDWDGWQLLSGVLMERNVLCVGDDFVVTNPDRTQKAIDLSAMSAMIIKPNQVGTLTEVFEVLKLCEENMIVPIISHRSADTKDAFISQLAYGVGAKYMKAGAPVRAERLEKYNELLRINANLAR